LGILEGELQESFGGEGERIWTTTMLALKMSVALLDDRPRRKSVLGRERIWIRMDAMV
jgi:hypothetical protein